MWTPLSVTYAGGWLAIAFEWTLLLWQAGDITLNHQPHPLCLCLSCALITVIWNHFATKTDECHNIFKAVRILHKLIFFFFKFRYKSFWWFGLEHIRDLSGQGERLILPIILSIQHVNSSLSSRVEFLQESCLFSQSSQHGGRHESAFDVLLSLPAWIFTMQCDLCWK